MTNRKLTPVIPEWMRKLPDRALIGTVEIAQIYGVSRKSIGPCIERGRIPACDFVTDRTSKKGGHQWVLGKIRKHVKEAA